MGSLLSDRDLLARLVAFETVSLRPNAPLLDWVSDYLDRPGLRVVRQEGPDPGRANLIVLAGEDPDPGRPSQGRAGLTLAGHVDVVPAGEPEWTSDPFELVERDGRLTARGAVDMKGFCALAINRMAAAASRTLAHPLALLLTFDEEVGSLGARHFVEQWPSDRPLPRSVVVGEPTSLRAVRMHKGHLRVRITIRGRAAHTGSPHLGVNAIEPAGPVLVALARLRRRMEAEVSEHARYFPEVPFAVLAVSGIRGGEAVNVIPARCEIEVGLRGLPGMRSDEGLERIREAVAASAGDASLEVAPLGDNPPLLTPEDAPLHRWVSRLVDQEESLGVSYASDAGWLGASGYECVLFGPGSMDLAHRPDESLPAVELEAAGRHLDALVLRACAGEERGP